MLDHDLMYVGNYNDLCVLLQSLVCKCVQLSSKAEGASLPLVFLSAKTFPDIRVSSQGGVKD